MRLAPVLPDRQTHLDMARGLAALAVCSSHLRAFQFVSFDAVQAPSVVDRAFYVLTGYGHQAVMVFFVLSGYFIAGSVADAVATHHWSWAGYALRRLTRLWTVLVPALLLTALWDGLGGLLTAGRGYDGRFADMLHSGPTSGTPLSGGWLDFMGNVLFLQTIMCPVFGSNSPLWSLANEFWYYLLFPLGYCAWRAEVSWPVRLLSGFACCFVAFWLPSGVMAAMAVWLLGFGVHLVMKSPLGVRAFANSTSFAVSSMVFLGSLLVTRSGAAIAGDCLVGIGFAGMMPFLICREATAKWYRRISTGLAECSYTLYVVHFPLFAFFFFSFRLPAKTQPGLGAYLAFFAALALTLGYAAGIWWAFEKRTDLVRKWAEAEFPRTFARKAEMCNRSVRAGQERGVHAASPRICAGHAGKPHPRKCRR